MKKPEIYEDYLKWINGEDIPSFEDNTIDDIRECSDYRKKIKESTGRK